MVSLGCTRADPRPTRPSHSTVSWVHSEMSSSWKSLDGSGGLRGGTLTFVLELTCDCRGVILILCSESRERRASRASSGTHFRACTWAGEYLLDGRRLQEHIPAISKAC